MQYSGRTSDKEIANAVRVAQSDERFDRLRYDIHDFLRCESFSFSPAVIDEMAATDAVAAQMLTGGPMAVAVVTDRQDVIASVDAYLNTGFNIHKVQVFSSIEESRAWIRAQTSNASQVGRAS